LIATGIQTGNVTTVSRGIRKGEGRKGKNAPQPTRLHAKGIANGDHRGRTCEDARDQGDRGNRKKENAPDSEQGAYCKAKLKNEKGVEEARHDAVLVRYRNRINCSRITCNQAARTTKLASIRA